RMTKVIKGEFKKHEDLMVKDVSLTCDTSLEVFNNEFNQMSGMDDDLFTYETEVANILCDSNKDDDSEQRMSYEADDDLGYDPSDVAFIEMTKVIKGEFEKLKDLMVKDVSLTCDTSLEVFNNEFNRMSGTDDDLFTYEVKVANIPYDSNKDDDSEQRMSHEADDDMGYDPSDVAFTECWRNDGFCNGGNLPGTYIKRWNVYDDANQDHEADEREELCEINKLPVCTIRRFKMIKYSFEQDEEYVAVKEDEYDDLARANENACRAYQEIFFRMTKVIKGEFKKLEDLMVKDVSLSCDTSLKVFNNEFTQMSGMDDDLFTYEVKVANIPCDSNKDDDSEQRMSHEADDDMGYDPSDVAYTKWLGSKKFNYKTMDHYTKKAYGFTGLEEMTN
ncbi:hypothetical protein Tco_1439288, partial [Tanacetum coccineum]